MMTTTTQTSEARVTCKPFTAFARGAYRVRVLADGTVQVWDSVAGHYTRCHSLSAAAQQRIRAKVLAK